MDNKPTHFKYVCRVCLKEQLQEILARAPENTPIPRCCGRERDMAFKGVHPAPQQ